MKTDYIMTPPQLLQSPMNPFEAVAAVVDAGEVAEESDETVAGQFPSEASLEETVVMRQPWPPLTEQASS